MTVDFKATITTENGSLHFNRKLADEGLSASVVSSSGQQLTLQLDDVEFLQVVKALYPDILIR